MATPFPPRNVVTSHYCPHCANGRGACGDAAGAQWPATSAASDINGSYKTNVNILYGGEVVEVAIHLTTTHQGYFVMGKSTNFSLSLSIAIFC